MSSTQHYIIVALAVAAFIMSVVLVSKHSEPFAITRKPSAKTAKKLDAMKASRKAGMVSSCQKATMNLCSKFTEPQKNAQAIYEVQQACGNQYQPLLHCPNTIPIGSTLLGGTNL
jgi:hypothetical protein